MSIPGKTKSEGRTVPGGRHVAMVLPSAAVEVPLLGSGPAVIGGAEVQLVRLARELRRRGWEVTFVLRPGPGPRELITPEGIGVVRLAQGRTWPLVPKLFTQDLRQAREAVRAVDADVYLQHCLNWQSAFILREAHRRGKRMVLYLGFLSDARLQRSSGRTGGYLHRLLTAQALRKADVVVAQTEEQRVAVRQAVGREAVLIPNLWEPEPEPIAPPVQPPEVLWAGRVHENKRPWLVLDLAERLPELRFVMAGCAIKRREKLYDEVTSRAAELPNVEFVGFVPFEQIGTYYERASAVLITSDMEGFPNVLLQAWSWGRPAVSSFDPDEVICRYDLGRHCATVDEMARALPEVVTGSESYAARARAYLREHHALDMVVSRFEQALGGA